MKAILYNRISQAQFVLIVFVWLLIFASPLLFGEFTNGINWEHLTKVWKEYSLLFIIFLANRFILMPYLFLAGRRSLYFAILAVVLSLFALLIIFLQDFLVVDSLQQALPGVEQPQDSNPPGGPGPQRPRILIPPYGNLLIMSILLIGFDSGLLFFSKWMQSEKIKVETEKESIKNKMAFLQNQVSPHFFMNTLNNIHALIDINSEEAKEAVIKLSRLMDYMLYESQSAKVPISREIDFIKSYVDLMKLRITDDIDLQLYLPENLPQVNLPPLLTISFIENAFKYGISYEQPSFIHISMDLNESRFNFSIKNRIHQAKQERSNSGIGIDNTRNRLDLLYGKNYNLEIDTKQDNFEVQLSIPL